MSKLKKFQAVIHCSFNDDALLDQALTHRSVHKSKNNERLEFLGDSVLSIVISEFIFNELASATEGELSRVRSSLVKEEALAKVARDIDLGQYIHLGAGELKSGGFRRDSILSDALEAVIGAVYLDQGFDKARSVILFLYQEYLVKLPSPTSLKDPKTRLQEYLQGKKIDLPIYHVIDSSGKSHNQVFSVSCSINALKLSSVGTGTSRKKAEQMAASQLFHELIDDKK
ncbi:MAG: ribonuclease III [Gammaproteobacteria bacterium]|nr:ribonuclease III [Gammaproteobacteria bacterium]